MGASRAERVEALVLVVASRRDAHGERLEHSACAAIAQLVELQRAPQALDERGLHVRACKAHGDQHAALELDQSRWRAVLEVDVERLVQRVSRFLDALIQRAHPVEGHGHGPAWAAQRCVVEVHVHAQPDLVVRERAGLVDGGQQAECHAALGADDSHVGEEVAGGLAAELCLGAGVFAGTGGRKQEGKS